MGLQTVAWSTERGAHHGRACETLGWIDPVEPTQLPISRRHARHDDSGFPRGSPAARDPCVESIVAGVITVHLPVTSPTMADGLEETEMGTAPA